MARGLLFNQWMPFAEPPDWDALKRSLTAPFGPVPDRLCPIKVVNERTHEVHKIVVQVEKLRRENVFVLQGFIIFINGEPWGEPHNRFTLRYDDENSSNCGFMIRHIHSI